VAWLLDKAGFQEVHTLKGGYKAFRAHVIASFDALPLLHVVGGYTGTGKTETLRHLKALGEQVVDLEALAHHKGSSFGMIGEPEQPTQEQFENTVWHALQAMDPQKAVWVEDESQMIGRNKLPDALYQAIRRSPLLFADMHQDLRVERLVQDYGSAPTEELALAITRISKRIGPQHAKAALEALAVGDLRTVTITALRYYDKTYAYGLSKRDAQQVITLPVSSPDLRHLAQRLKDHVAATDPHR
jgi:tRNA 2-selenouridine synthase